MSETARKPQAQDRQPGREQEMEPRPQAEMRNYRGAGKLDGKIALISGGDSGIGRAVAIGFAKEGADVAITYLDEHEDAQETIRLIEAEGRRAMAVPGDIGNSDFSRELVRQVVAAFGRIDILVNNAAEQHQVEQLEKLSDEQLERTFRTNIFGQFFLTRAALPEMPEGLGDHQHDIGDGISGQSDIGGLCKHQGCDRRIHAVTVEAVGEAEDPGERGGAGADLDAADSGELFGGEDGKARTTGSDGPGG